MGGNSTYNFFFQKLFSHGSWYGSKQHINIQSTIFSRTNVPAPMSNLDGMRCCSPFLCQWVSKCSAASFPPHQPAASVSPGSRQKCKSVMLCMHAWTKSFQSCPTLCNPMDGSPLGSFVPGILQARRLEWAAKPSSGGSSPPGDGTCVSYISCIGRQILNH